MVFLVGFPEAISDENIFFIVSPKDIVVSRQRDQDDHITWLLEHEMFEVKYPSSASWKLRSYLSHTKVILNLKKGN